MIYNPIYTPQTKNTPVDTPKKSMRLNETFLRWDADILGIQRTNDQRLL